MRPWALFLECVLARGLRWSLLSKFMKTRISQAAATIPLIGYALIWSEKLGQYVELNKELGSTMWFEPTVRLLLLYYGALFLTAAYAVYYIACPDELKRTPVIDDYLFREMQTGNDLEYSRIVTLLRAKIVQPEIKNGSQQWLVDEVPITLRNELSASTVHQGIHGGRGIPTEGRNPGLRNLVLQAWFHFNEGRNTGSLVAVTICSIVGLFLVLLPSLEVLSFVTVRVLAPKLIFW